jgi:hypothetical protein
MRAESTAVLIPVDIIVQWQRGSPQQVRRVAVKVVRNGSVVHAVGRQKRLHVVLSDILGYAHCPENPLAVVCTR